jgi:hypothetical protein
MKYISVWLAFVERYNGTEILSDPSPILATKACQSKTHLRLISATVYSCEK